MTEIQQNRWDQLIRRAANIVAPGSMVGDALNELFPTLDVENVPGELLILMGTRLAHGGTTFLGAAGQVARHQLFNPVDSGMIITLTTVVMSSESTSKLRWGRSAAALTSSPATQIFRETRIPITTLPVGQIRTESSVAFSPATGQVPIAVNASFTLQDPNGVFILGPGQGFEFSNNTAATRTNSWFVWRERLAEPAELNF